MDFAALIVGSTIFLGGLVGLIFAFKKESAMHFKILACLFVVFGAGTIVRTILPYQIVDTIIIIVFCGLLLSWVTIFWIIPIIKSRKEKEESRLANYMVDTKASRDALPVSMIGITCYVKSENKIYIYAVNGWIENKK